MYFLFHFFKTLLVAKQRASHQGIHSLSEKTVWLVLFSSIPLPHRNWPKLYFLLSFDFSFCQNMSPPLPVLWSVLDRYCFQYLAPCSSIFHCFVELWWTASDHRTIFTLVYSVLLLSFVFKDIRKIPLLLWNLGHFLLFPFNHFFCSRCWHWFFQDHGTCSAFFLILLIF